MSKVFWKSSPHEAVFFCVCGLCVFGSNATTNTYFRYSYIILMNYTGILPEHFGVAMYRQCLTIKPEILRTHSVRIWQSNKLIIRKIYFSFLLTLRRFHIQDRSIEVDFRRFIFSLHGFQFLHFFFEFYFIDWNSNSISSTMQYKIRILSKEMWNIHALAWNERCTQNMNGLLAQYAIVKWRAKEHNENEKSAQKKRNKSECLAIFIFFFLFATAFSPLFQTDFSSICTSCTVQHF